MRIALLVAALSSLLSAGLAGCLEGDLSLLTAKDARRQADREAEEWAGDAELMSIYGIEAGAEARSQMAEMAAAGRQGPAGGGQDDEMDAEMAMVSAVSGTEDDDVGDGHAPMWAFAYLSEELQDILAVAVSSEGILFAEAEGGIETGAFSAGRPVTDWRLDSDEAAEVAGTDEGFAAAVQDPKAFVYTMLFEGKEGPVWIYGVESSADGEDESMVALSAVDGRILDANELITEVFGFVIREFGEASGTGAVQFMGEFGTDFEVQLAGHETMVVVVTVSPPPVMPMQVTVTDAEGMEHTGTVGSSLGLESTAIIHLEAVPPGDYDVSVAVEVGVANTWEIAWCTDGSAIIPQSNRACELVGSSAALPAPSRESLWETLSPLRRSPAA